MLCYLPLTAPELLGTVPPPRPALVPARDAEASASQQDLAEHLDECHDDAAIQSLELARIEGSAPVRLLASAEVATEDALVLAWDQVDSFYVDDDAGRALCAALFVARSQEEADGVMEQLFEEPLMWFDASEREDLGRALVSAESVDEVRQD